MKNSYVFVALISAFIIGIGATLLVVNVIDTDSVITARNNLNSDNDANIDKQTADYKQQLDVVMSQIQRINNRIDQIVEKKSVSDDALEYNDVSIESINEVDIIVDGKNDVETISDEELQIVKDKIYDSLSSRMMTVPQVLESAEVKALPKAAQRELVLEIVRRFNAGELSLGSE